MASTWEQQGQKPGFANRISSIFERRRVQSQDPESARATTTFEVPLFLSPSRYQPSQVSHQDQNEHLSHLPISSPSNQSFAGTTISSETRLPVFPPAPSSRYSSTTPSPTTNEPPSLSITEEIVPATGHRSQHRPNRTRAVRPGQVRRRKKRRSSSAVRIQGLKRLSASFAATLLVTLITYLILAVTGTAGGIMFHVLLILLILTLAGIFAHSVIRLFIEIRNVKQNKVQRRRMERWHGSITQEERPYYGEMAADIREHEDEYLPEKPIRVVMVDDVEANLAGTGETPKVRQPPPVYGNFRSSKRINPSLVQWQKIPPSPLTPTYDEAMLDVHHAVGYRPPSYIQSDSGATRIVEQGKQDVDDALRNIHPLERRRIDQLRHNLI